MTIDRTLFPVGAALRRWPCKPALGRVETRPGVVYAQRLLARNNVRKEQEDRAKKWRRGIKIAVNGRVEGRRRAIFTALSSQRGRAAEWQTWLRVGSREKDEPGSR